MTRSARRPPPARRPDTGHRHAGGCAASWRDVRPGRRSAGARPRRDRPRHGRTPRAPLRAPTASAGAMRSDSTCASRLPAADSISTAGRLRAERPQFARQVAAVLAGLQFVLDRTVPPPGESASRDRRPSASARFCCRARRSRSLALDARQSSAATSRASSAAFVGQRVAMLQPSVERAQGVDARPRRGRARHARAVRRRVARGSRLSTSRASRRRPPRAALVLGDPDVVGAPVARRTARSLRRPAAPGGSVRCARARATAAQPRRVAASSSSARRAVRSLRQSRARAASSTRCARARSRASTQPRLPLGRAATVRARPARSPPAWRRHASSSCRSADSTSRLASRQRSPASFCMRL